jgi:hypothetical protein
MAILARILLFLEQTIKVTLIQIWSLQARTICLYVGWRRFD